MFRKGNKNSNKTPPPKKPSTPPPKRPVAPPRKIPTQLHTMLPTKMTGQLVAVKPPPRPSTGPAKKTPSPPRPTTGPAKKPSNKTPSPPRPTTGPTKKPSNKTPSPPRPTTGPMKKPTGATKPIPMPTKHNSGFMGLFKKAAATDAAAAAAAAAVGGVRPATGPTVKPTTQWSTFDNISLNEIRNYARQYRNKSSQDIYKILITKCNPHDANKNVCKYDVEILSRIIHSYPLSGKAPNAPQTPRAVNKKTPLATSVNKTTDQKNADKKFSDLLRHITHDYDLVYKYNDIPVEQMLKRVNDLKVQLNQFKNASNNLKSTAAYKQRNAEYILIYKYIDANKHILETLVSLKSKLAQLEKNPTNKTLAKLCVQLYKQVSDLNNSIPVKYRLLNHLNLKFMIEGMAKNKLVNTDPTFVKLQKQAFTKIKK